mmetsp:Transcript_7621/g.23780  ORF Transcript_7621/g.23780 Transcript_7621/m.23780 type:complete len:322 (-) Transcript_7621:670-1635(-)
MPAAAPSISSFVRRGPKHGSSKLRGKMTSNSSPSSTPRNSFGRLDSFISPRRLSAASRAQAGLPPTPRHSASDAPDESDAEEQSVRRELSHASTVGQSESSITGYRLHGIPNAPARHGQRERRRQKLTVGGRAPFAKVGNVLSEAVQSIKTPRSRRTAAQHAQRQQQTEQQHQHQQHQQQQHQQQQQRQHAMGTPRSVPMQQPSMSKVDHMRAASCNSACPAESIISRNPEDEARNGVKDSSIGPFLGWMPRGSKLSAEKHDEPAPDRPAEGCSTDSPRRSTTSLRRSTASTAPTPSTSPTASPDAAPWWASVCRCIAGRQ